ncbi:MAG: sialate O-acetylesterase [Bacteroidota bacterium]
MLTLYYHLMTYRSVLLISLLLCSGEFLSARIILPSIISDHMMLQQMQEVKLWGWSTQSNEDIRIWASWGEDTVEVPVRGGYWEATISTPAAGGPYELSFMGRRPGDQALVRDVLIGEVWLASGQSNMEWSLNRVENGEQEIAAADYPEIRLFKAERRTARTPQDDLHGEWVVCTPEAVAEYSAVAYFFSQTLHQRSQLPVGCVLSAWGGTQADAWTPVEALKSDPVVAEAARGLANGQRSPRSPGILYNAMIHPLQNFRIKGALWYQGESNRERADTYQALMVQLIESWRERWGYDFPFYFVQIAPYDYGLRNSNGGPYLREAQLQTLSVPQTGMVVTADVGDFTNIHPQRKRPVGDRLAYWALAKDYGSAELAYSGPLYRDLTLQRDQALISFKYAGGGLKVKGDQLAEIYVAGADRVFYPARAKIKGEQLIVSSPQVPQPVAVRYGFSDTDQMNLFNEAGLPASPFRTDDWPHATVRVRWDYGLSEKAISGAELLEWTFWGEGEASPSGGQVLLKEAEVSAGVMLISPESWTGDVVLRYRVQALTPATVIVTLLAASDAGESTVLTLPKSYDGSIGMWTKEKENYFVAYKNAPHGLTPFVRKQPNARDYLAQAEKNVMVAGQYYEVEVGKLQGKLWLSVDGEKLFQQLDESPLAGGHLAIRLRGTGGFPAACLIQEVRLLHE